MATAARSCATPSATAGSSRPRSRRSAPRKCSSGSATTSGSSESGRLPAAADRLHEQHGGVEPRFADLLGLQLERELGGLRDDHLQVVGDAVVVLRAKGDGDDAAVSSATSRLLACRRTPTTRLRRRGTRQHGLPIRGDVLAVAPRAGQVRAQPPPRRTAWRRSARSPRSGSPSRPGCRSWCLETGRAGQPHLEERFRDAHLGVRRDRFCSASATSGRCSSSCDARRGIGGARGRRLRRDREVGAAGCTAPPVRAPRRAGGRRRRAAPACWRAACAPARRRDADRPGARELRQPDLVGEDRMLSRRIASCASSARSAKQAEATSAASVSATTPLPASLARAARWPTRTCRRPRGRSRRRSNGTDVGRVVGRGSRRRRVRPVLGYPDRVVRRIARDDRVEVGLGDPRRRARLGDAGDRELEVLVGAPRLLLQRGQRGIAEQLPPFGVERGRSGARRRLRLTVARGHFHRGTRVVRADRAPGAGGEPRRAPAPARRAASRLAPPARRARPGPRDQRRRRRRDDRLAPSMPEAISISHRSRGRARPAGARSSAPRRPPSAACPRRRTRSRSRQHAPARAHALALERGLDVHPGLQLPVRVQDVDLDLHRARARRASPPCARSCRSCRCPAPCAPRSAPAGRPSARRGPAGSLT